MLSMNKVHTDDVSESLYNGYVNLIKSKLYWDCMSGIHQKISKPDSRKFEDDGEKK